LPPRLAQGRRRSGAMTRLRRGAKLAAMSKANRNPAATERQRRYALAGRQIDLARLAPGLYVVATPIGNLGDVTLRALEALAAADVIACEDTRVTRKLLDRYLITTPLTPYHEHNAAQARPMLLQRLAQGASVALVSDAGTPLVSDPGFKLVRAAQEAGLTVTALPGASSLLAALTVAGLPTNQFLFAGFLPPKQAARRSRIAELSRIPATLVFFETGPRIAATLADLADGLGEQREAALCRELTKLHEAVLRGNLKMLAQACAEKEPRGEIVLVIAPPQMAQPASVAKTETLLREALSRASVKDAVDQVADLTGLPRREIYQRALALVKTEGKANDGAPR
jgi:16S rRNA (cytidine1402-2'-O)-methyltransferase